MRRSVVIVVIAALLQSLCLPVCGQNADMPRTLVIDAGHGGEDGGAVSADGVLEGDINLKIALRLEALAHFCGVDTRMTRSSAEIDYPPELLKTAQRKVYDQKERVRLIRETPNAVLISVHQNKYPDARPRGPQVLYGANAESRDFGALAHELLTAAVYPENRRVAAPISKDIYLMRMVDCPAILAECGFLSNREEAALLTTDACQTRIACALLCAWLQYFQP